MKITLFDSDLHTESTVLLWQEVFGYGDARNDPELSFQKKLEAKDELFFVALQDEQVNDTIMAGYDGHRGWVYSLAVAPSLSNQGIGSQLVQHAEQALIKLGYQTELRISMGKQVLENLPPRNDELQLGK